MSQNYCYVQKGTGEILRVPINEWGKYLGDGFHMSTKDAYYAQVIDPVDIPDVPAAAYDISVSSSKPEILEFAKQHNIEVDAGDTKADLLWGIAQVLSVDPAVFGVEADEG